MKKKISIDGTDLTIEATVNKEEVEAYSGMFCRYLNMRATAYRIDKTIASMMVLVLGEKDPRIAGYIDYFEDMARNAVMDHESVPVTDAFKEKGYE